MKRILMVLASLAVGQVSAQTVLAKLSCIDHDDNIKNVRIIEDYPVNALVSEDGEKVKFAFISTPDSPTFFDILEQTMFQHIVAGPAGGHDLFIDLKNRIAYKCSRQLDPPGTPTMPEKEVTGEVFGMVGIGGDTTGMGMLIDEKLVEIIGKTSEITKELRTHIESGQEITVWGKRSLRRGTTRGEYEVFQVSGIVK